MTQLIAEILLALKSFLNREQKKAEKDKSKRDFHQALSELDDAMNKLSIGNKNNGHHV